MKFVQNARRVLSSQTIKELTARPFLSLDDDFPKRLAAAKAREGMSVEDKERLQGCLRSSMIKEVAHSVAGLLALVVYSAHGSADIIYEYGFGFHTGLSLVFPAYSLYHIIRAEVDAINLDHLQKVQR
ncbi:MAG: hypothetical protein ACYCOU_00655 [Sulfobacillus sp.]